MPLGDIVSTLVCVEISAVRVGAGIGDTAASATRGVISAVFTSLNTGLSLAFGLALGIGVKYEAVDRVLVDTFDDVNLSLDGPWLAAESPEGRPGTADATRHVLDIENEEALVVLLFSFKSNTFATDVTSVLVIQHGRVVDAKDSITVIVADVALVMGSLAVDIPSWSQRLSPRWYK